VETIAGRNSPVFDVGLPVYGPGIAPGAVITSVTGAGSKNLNLGGPCAPTCVTTVNGTPITIRIGDPSGTAPSDGDLGADLGLLIDLDPAFLAGAQDCAAEEPEGIHWPGRIYNPGSFQSTMFGATPPSGVRVVAQLVFGSGAGSELSAFIVQRPALAAGDPHLYEHFDVVFPSLPFAVAMCNGSPTTSYASPGLGMSLTILGQTAGQSQLATGTGRPGTAHLRSVRPVSGGYLSTVYLQSDSGPTFTPTANFHRICIFPASSEVSFTCGNG
jgi:hypothetical protein